jgi:hypothetical protein
MYIYREHIAEKYLNDLIPLWLSAPVDFPGFMDAVQADVKARNVEFIENINSIVSDHFNKIYSKRVRWFSFFRKRWADKMEALTGQFLRDEPILGICKHLSPETIAAVNSGIKEFLASARHFAPEMSFANLGQAVRNYLVYSMFLELSNKKQLYTSAIFGYSMLYPMTDNYIDGGRSDEEKRAYNNMIRDKLNGMPVSPDSAHKRQTCELIDCIEFVHPRSKDAGIYELLSLMLEAQHESLVQQDKQYTLSVDRVLEISLNKGGLSVLIDRWLVDPCITDAELCFYLGYGLILQLVDDLQDISSDLREGSQTLFTLAPGPGALEGLVNQLLNFTDKLFSGHTLPNKEFQVFLRISTILLILMSAGMSRECFRADYIRTLEDHFPLPFPFLTRYTKNSSLYPKGMDEKDLLRAIDMLAKEDKI